MDLYLDTETFSELELKKVGAYRYSEECELLLLTYALDDEPVQAVDLTAPGNEHALEQLQRDVDDAERVIIHNSAFDRQVLAAHGVVIPIEKIEDTMVTALRHSLPAGLGELCDVMQVPYDMAKDKDGKKLIQLFCKPRPKNMKLRRATRDTHPEEWQHFISYAKLDVDAMRYVRRELPRWNNSDSEQSLWRLDQTINDRGIAVDLEFARAALGGAARAGRSLAAAVAAETGGIIKSATQREKLLTYLRDACGFDPGDLKGGTIAALLKTDLDPKVRRLLTNRKQAAATSPAKYQVLLNAACRDRRLRGLLQYCGASRTGRWGGRLFQPQNLPRPSLLWPDIELGIDALMSQMEDVLFDQPMDLVTSAIRSALVAEEGKKLVIADLSNIEGRMLAWMADEQWKVKAFREFDAGVGHDLYVLAYARSFNVAPEVVLDNKKNGDGKMRQVGKVMELACIAENEPVLTDGGLKPIQEVLLTDLVWDGEAFVAHDGVVFRGEKVVGEYQGLTATPDHLVFVEGSQRAVPFGHAAASGARLVQSGSGGTPLRVGGGAHRRTALSAKMALSVCRRALHRMRVRAVGCCDAVALRKVERVPSLLPAPPCSEVAGATVLGSEATLRQSEGKAVRFLRRAGDNFRVQVSDRHGRVDRGEPRVGARQTARSHRQRQGVRTGKPALGNTTGKPSELANPRPAKTYDILNAGPRNRFTASGRLVHNCGYQGSVGAFNTMGLIYNVVLPDDEALAIVKAWRKAHASIVSFWYDLDRKVKQAVREPGKTIEHGPIRLRVDHHWLRLRLPSGRYLSYPGVAVHGGRCTECNGEGFIMVDPSEDTPGMYIICDACEGKGRHPETIWYSGVNQYTRKWQRIQTYGGKLTENLVQAASRDVLAANMQTAEDKGYSICLHVHDELITETPDDPRFSSDELEAIMATNPAWSIGLPLAAGGYETHRYRKEQ